MGRFINELKQRGAYLYGSRELNASGPDSDWDWACPYSEENIDWLYKCGFKTDNSYKKRKRNQRGNFKNIEGLSSETMESFRKGTTNVILMSPLLFRANQYATQMLKGYNGEGLVKTKEGRVTGYQRYSEEYVQLVGVNNETKFTWGPDLDF